ncbi:hypothetical protein DFH09DRAFT_982328, partial [Mycena vulgaris]
DVATAPAKKCRNQLGCTFLFSLVASRGLTDICLAILNQREVTWNVKPFWARGVFHRPDGCSCGACFRGKGAQEYRIAPTNIPPIQWFARGDYSTSSLPHEVSNVAVSRGNPTV